MGDLQARQHQQHPLYPRRQRTHCWHDLPPEKDCGYWTGEEGQYYETVEDTRGRLVGDWRGWLERRSGDQTDAPRVGSDRCPPIEDATGTYVKEMHNDA